MSRSFTNLTVYDEVNMFKNILKFIFHFLKPKTEYYRNKNEFNFRMGADGDPKTLGFFVGRPRCGDVICIRPTHLLCVSQRHKNIAAVRF